MFDLQNMGVWGALHLAIFLVCVWDILSGPRTAGTKVLWLVLVFLLPCLGVILYILLGRKAA